MAVKVDNGDFVFSDYFDSPFFNLDFFTGPASKKFFEESSFRFPRCRIGIKIYLVDGKFLPELPSSNEVIHLSFLGVTAFALKLSQAICIKTLRAFAPFF